MRENDFECPIPENEKPTPEDCYLCKFYDECDLIVRIERDLSPAPTWFLFAIFFVLSMWTIFLGWCGYHAWMFVKNMLSGA